jgi:hypothetical protein
MPLVDTSTLDVIERLPGWRGRYFHSPSMTFAHYEFTRGASVNRCRFPAPSGCSRTLMPGRSRLADAWGSYNMEPSTRK